MPDPDDDDDDAEWVQCVQELNIPPPHLPKGMSGDQVLTEARIRQLQNVRVFYDHHARQLGEFDPKNPAHLHELLDMILALREDARGEGGSAATEVGHDAAALLIQGAMSWIRPGRPRYSGNMSFEDLEADPWRWRHEVSSHLSAYADLLPERLRKPLVDALCSLGDGSGETPTLLAPRPRDGWGKNPSHAHYYERKLICWIFYEVGRGKKVEAAREIVRKETGRSTKAVQAWQTKWRRENAAEMAFNKRRCRARGEAGLAFDDKGTTLKGIVRKWQDAQESPRER